MSLVLVGCSWDQWVPPWRMKQNCGPSLTVPCVL